MSTQTRHGPHGLPEVYQVHIPKDRTDYPHKEFNKIMKIAAPNCYRGGGLSGGWHKIENEDYICQHDKYLNIPEVSYEDWKKAILGEPDPVYKVGDEVELISHTKGNDLYYTSSIGTKAKVISLTSKHWPNDTSRIGVMVNGDECGWYKADIRHATPEEIDIATGKKKPAKNGKEWICTSEDGVELYDGDIGNFVALQEKEWIFSSKVGVCKRHVDKAHTGCLTTGNYKVFSTEQAAKDWIELQNGTGWKVGDKLLNVWLNKQKYYSYTRSLSTLYNPPGNFINDDEISEVDKDGRGKIKTCNNVWLPPKHQCTPLPVEDKGWDKDSKIWYNEYSEYQKYWKPVLQSDGKYRMHVEGDSSPGSAIYTEADITGRIKGGIWTLTKPTNPVDLVKQVPVTTSEAKEWVPKIGEWVYVLSVSGDCQVGDVRKIYRTKDGIYCLAEEGSYWIALHQIRPATPEEIAKAQGTQIPVTAENAVIGMRVVRGKDWNYGNQDMEDDVQKVGTIVANGSYFPTRSNYRWVRVQWENGDRQVYRIGYEDKYDLYIASDNTVTKQSINNNQTKTKNNDKENHSSKQDSSISSSKSAQLTYLEIRQQSSAEIEEQQLQYDVLDNLSSLTDSIEETQRQLNSTKRHRETLLQKKEVDWNALAQQDNKIAGYVKGLEVLKGYRNSYFPDWRSLRTQD